MEDFTVVCPMFMNICGKFTQPTVAAFMATDIVLFNGIFYFFSLAGGTKLIMGLKICQWILKQLFYMIEILLFVLSASYCFKFSRAPPLSLSNYNDALGRMMFEKDL